MEEGWLQVRLLWYWAWVVGIVACAVTFLTPYEARLMGSDVTWLFLLNGAEAGIFLFGLGVGLAVANQRVSS